MALIGTLTSGVSALKTFTKDLEVIGNNIANVNTTAFKSSSVAIGEDFVNTLQASLPGNSTQSNIEAAQIGTGVKLDGVNVNYNQGALTTTGSSTDLGISGSGFFLVQNPTDSTTYATRVGSFRWDDNGYLVNAQGMRVQGLTVATPTTSGAPTYSTSLGSIRRTSAGGTPPTPLDTSGNPLSVQSLSVDKAGEVVEFYDNGSSAVVGKVLLENFNQPGSLMDAGNGLYTNLAYAGPTQGLVGSTSLGGTSTTGDAGSNGLGTIESGTLEQSNVDLTEQFANMITAQRSFQAAARLVTVSDSVLQEIVDLKRS